MTEETFRVLHEYVKRTTPAANLIQASVSNGELSGGGMTPGAIYARVEHLGAVQGFKGKLTVEACYAYHDPSITVPKPCKRTLTKAVEPQRPQQCEHVPPSLASPTMSLERLMEGLSHLEERLGALVYIQQGGNITPHLESVCMQLDAECETLEVELASLRQVVKVLPLHFMLLRLFPQREALLSESLLLRLEVCATTNLSEAFLAALLRSTAEEHAYRACARLVAQELGEDVVERLADLLRGVVVYAGMHTQRQIDALRASSKTTIG
ncbi:hypothetical protein KSF_106840 [Reticulibacter mediterranei]|uniref:Uncharacterized protein n=1 Tax=Reticulibacter mediterranei TaxID=2778369 RepID=A0A8J3J320_9CHLR|nr:hypothetical protein [Reticulibacter mediterranei]GHP00637.1 hypothetical protein KSF_106840 [Reticulibacter mediterranei]